MAKKISALFIISLLIVASATPAFCGGDPLTKLGRGLCNVATFPLELAAQPVKTKESDGPLAGLTVGVVKGIQMTVVRAAVGVFEVATFMIPCPKDYQPILTDPEYFLQDIDF
jgi:putative exosortase-associated protein (TIGR04073 family)